MWLFIIYASDNFRLSSSRAKCAFHMYKYVYISPSNPPTCAYIRRGWKHFPKSSVAQSYYYAKFIRIIFAIHSKCVCVCVCVCGKGCSRILPTNMGKYVSRCIKLCIWRKEDRIIIIIKYECEFSKSGAYVRRPGFTWRMFSEVGART